MSDHFNAFDLKNFLSQIGSSVNGHTSLSLCKELLDNGIDASSTKISISGEKTLDKYIVKYSDNGNGMNKEDLFRCIQFYSKNRNGGIGKFGIGGASCLVCWSDINGNHKYKYIHIISKTRDGTVRSIFINWNNCHGVTEFNKEVNGSFVENSCRDIELMEHISHGSTFIISTSARKYEELDEMTLVMENYMDIGQTYKNYLDQELSIHLFNDTDKINHFMIKDCLLCETIPVEIYRRGKNTAYSAKIGRAYHSFTHGKTKKLKKIDRADVVDNWNMVCIVYLKLTFPNNIYSEKEIIDFENSPKQFNTSNWNEFNSYCHSEGIIDSSEIKQTIIDFIRPLYVSRKNNGNSIYNGYSRMLGTLDFPAHGSGSRSSGDFTQTAQLYTYKELIFEAKDDENLGLIQQNKSVIEWTNTPKDFKEFLRKMTNEWIKIRLCKKFDELDLIVDKKRKKYLPVKHFCMRHKDIVKTGLDMKYCFGSKDDVIHSANTIQLYWKYYRDKTYKKKTKNAIIIQNWFRSKKILKSSPISGFIKFQVFCKWAHTYYCVNKIQKWWKQINFVRNLKLVKFQKLFSAIVIQNAWKKYLKQKTEFNIKTKAAIIIQKNVRRFLAINKLKHEKELELQYSRIIAQSSIQFPKTRNEFYKWNIEFNRIKSLVVDIL